MIDFHVVLDPKSDEKGIQTNLRGKELLNIPQLNKGTAFSREERMAFGLLGKLPYHVESLEEQVARTYFQLQNQGSRLSKYIFLNNLHDKNQILFYKVIETYLHELLPVIYTPTVGTAVKTFSQKFRRPRGLYIAYEDRDHIDEILDNRSNADVDLIVVTDGEGVLGIGDQGVGSMDIPIAKLAVYTTLGGIDPNRTLPITLDVGTENVKLLNNTMYLGWRHERVRGKAYDEFADQFVSAVKKKFPHCFLHWEDFGRQNAQRLLDRYKDQLCTFNDDIQGTGVVALAAILAAVTAKDETLAQQRIVVFGGGTAGLGITHRLCHALVDLAGLSEKEAKEHFWIIDRQGLLLNNSTDLTAEQKKYARASREIVDWADSDFAEVIKQVKPTILIGCSGVAGAFSEKIIKEMAKHTAQPIILSLSNPTKLAEAVPQDLLDWTNNRALIATGSPFPNCSYHDQEVRIAQCNNALMFPPLGLAILAVQAKRLTETMLSVAAQTLAKQAPIASNPQCRELLPEISHTYLLAKDLALIIAKQAVAEKMCAKFTDDEIRQRIAEISWQPTYLPFSYVKSLK
ncbi:MAG: NAD-dependent malic enzyme [Gammaproteobacteria bacterium]|nr:NAD-dependent malic enzyme [Gammaproteobacteria bacterium]